MSLPRGIRNNNPGNIRWGSNWQGLVPQSQRTDKSFCQFKDAAHGLRAIVKILFTYRDKYGLNTIEGIIHRYAPPFENSTDNYIKRVCDSLGIGRKDVISFSDSQLMELLKAIIAVENGNQYYDYYPYELLMRAIKMARG